MTSTVYPREEWERVSPSEAGFFPDKLDGARRWLETNVKEGRYRVVIVRGGRIAAEWNHGVRRDEQLWLASATKSIFSCILGIAIDEGRLPSADAKLADVYKVFHYQTYGMNVLTHTIAKTYGLYDIRHPEDSPGFRQLVDEKLRKPIRANWGYYLSNFDLHRLARINIFGYYDGVKASARDIARLGWLWRNWGRWEDQQLIAEAWLREATKTAPGIHANCPQEQWRYGYGFWTNDYGQLWPVFRRIVTLRPEPAANTFGSAPASTWWWHRVRVCGKIRRTTTPACYISLWTQVHKCGGFTYDERTFMVAKGHHLPDLSQVISGQRW